MIKQDIHTYQKENIYDLDNHIVMYDYAERIVKAVKEERNAASLRVLELGLGHGYTASVFSGAFEDYTILEGDEGLIRKFRKEHGEVQAEIIHTMFEDYHTSLEYDVIIMGFILEHVDNPVEIMRKYGKILARGGVIYITVPNAEALNRRVGQAAGLLDDLKQLSEHDVRAGHKRYYDVGTIAQDCEKAGLVVRKIEGIFLKPITTEQMIKLHLPDDILRGFCETGRKYPELCLSLFIEAKKACDVSNAV